MRSAVALAAFAAGALAVPYGHRHHKREIHTDYDIVVTTAVVYVTAGEAAPTAAAVSVTSAADTTTVAVPTSTHISVSTHEKWGGHDSANQQKPSPAQPSVIVVTSVLGQQTPSSTYIPPPAPTSTVVAQPQVESSPAPAPAPAPQTSTPAPSSSSANQGGNTYQQTVVLHHNVHRANHSSPNIEWSDNLATSAGMVAATCNYNHQMNFMGGGYGQNIAIGVKPDNISSVITDMFYNGEVGAFADCYGQANPPGFKYWGHFSQVVWAASTQVGCATQYCPQGVINNPDPTDIPPYFTVCNYGAEGNMGGEYGANIGQSLGHPSVNSFYQG